MEPTPDRRAPFRPTMREAAGMAKEFCPSCRRSTELDLVVRKETYPVRGEPVEIEANVRVCRSCGRDLFDPVLDDENLRKAYGIYRSERGLLGPEEVKIIRESLGLTQRGLAKLLGWSPATVNRYEKAGVATSAHNDMLKLIGAPDRPPALLRERIDSLSTEDQERFRQAAGKRRDIRLIEAVRTLLEDRPPTVDSGYRALDLDRLAQMIAFFTRGSGMLKAKLMKLLWYSDLLHFREETVGISGGIYVRLPNGPALEDRDFIFGFLAREKVIAVDLCEGVTTEGKAWSGEMVRALAEPVLSVFSDSEVRAMGEVRTKLGRLSATRLSERSRKERAWVETQDGDLIPYSFSAHLSM